MYVNCFPLHFCCLQLVTKAMLLYNSAICDLLRESIQIMKILIHLKVVILVSEKWNEHNLMYIDHKQCEIMQKIQWNSSKEGAREKALAKLPISKIEGPAPQFWKRAPPLKNDQFRGQKHLENAPKKFCTIRTYIKFTFCKKIGPYRPIQPSAVVRIFHCRSYGVPTTN